MTIYRSGKSLKWRSSIWASFRNWQLRAFSTLLWDGPSLTLLWDLSFVRRLRTSSCVCQPPWLLPPSFPCKELTGRDPTRHSTRSVASPPPTAATWDVVWGSTSPSGGKRPVSRCTRMGTLFPRCTSTTNKPKCQPATPISTPQDCEILPHLRSLLERERQFYKESPWINLSSSLDLLRQYSYLKQNAKILLIKLITTWGFGVLGCL